MASIGYFDRSQHQGWRFRNREMEWEFESIKRSINSGMDIDRLIIAYIELKQDIEALRQIKCETKKEER